MSGAVFTVFFFLMIRRPPRSTLDRSSAASDVYKRQEGGRPGFRYPAPGGIGQHGQCAYVGILALIGGHALGGIAVSYTHLRAHETVLDLVCRLLLEKKNNKTHYLASTLSV